MIMTIQVSRLVALLGAPPEHMLQRGKDARDHFNAPGDPLPECLPPERPPVSGGPGGGAGQPSARCGKYMIKSAAQVARETGAEEVVSKQYFKGSTLEAIVTTYPFQKSMPAGERQV